MASKIKCVACGNEKLPTRDFYKTYSNMYKNIGRIPICKACIGERYNELLTEYDGDKNASVIHLFMNLDIYYDEDLFNKCDIQAAEDDTNAIGVYLQKINSLKPFKGKSSLNFKYGNDSNGCETIETQKSKVKKEDKISEEIVDKWGDGYESHEYIKLEKRYKKLEKSYPSETLQQREIIKTICELELEKTKCRIEKRYGDYDKIIKQISTKMGELDVIPSKQKTYDEDNQVTFGTTMKLYEQNKPIIDKQDIYKDVDWIEKYWNRIFKKPFAVAMGLAKGNYTVDDGDKNIQYNDDIKELMEENSDDN